MDWRQWVNLLTAAIFTVFGLFCIVKGRYQEALLAGIYVELKHLHHARIK